MQATGRNIISADEKIVRFEALHAQLARPAEAASEVDRLRTGCDAIDEAVGGLRRGMLSEFCGSTGNGSLFLAVLLDVAAREGCHLGLIDGGDTFQAEDWDGAQLRRMFLVRCPDAPGALKAADLLLRDGNLRLLVLDLQNLPARQLRRIPPNTWHRFQRVMEQQGNTVFVVITLYPMVEGARMRVRADLRWPLDAMWTRRRQLVERMSLSVREKGGQSRVAAEERKTA
jgi:hypothetical protein